MRHRTKVVTWLAASCVTMAAAPPAGAGQFTQYNDRTAWTAAAVTAGLTVSTESFATQPAGFPTFSVGPATFDSTLNPHDAADGRLEEPDAGSDLRVDYRAVTANTGVFGLAYDYGPDNPRILTVDADGVLGTASQNGAGTGFLGLIGTAAFDPLVPSSGFELVIDSNSLSYLDNLSVASRPIPEPTSSAAAIAAAAVVASGRQRRTRNRSH